MSEIEKPAVFSVKTAAGANKKTAAGANKKTAADANESAAVAKSASTQAQQAKTIEVERVSPAKFPNQKEINGPKGLEPTRYGDWESKGRCHDF